MKKFILFQFANLKLPSFFTTFSCLIVSCLLQLNTAKAQVTTCTNCKANDINIISVELVQLNQLWTPTNGLPKYISLPATCTGSEQLTGILKITVDQNASTRYGFRVYGDILIDDHFSSVFNYCDPSDFTSGTYSNIYVETVPIIWTCGTKISIRNFFVGWAINNGNPNNPTSACTPTDACDLDPHCRQFISPKDPDIVVVTPLSADFSATGSCPTGKTVQTYSFNALDATNGTTGGTIPYPANAYSWSISNSSGEVGTMTGSNPTYDFSTLGIGTYTVTLTVTDDLPAATSSISKTITVVSCCTTPVIASQTPAAICSGGSITLGVSDFTGSNTIPSNTTFTWLTPSAPGVTVLGSGTDQTSFSTGTLTNNTNSPIDVIYTITPKSESCSGSSFTVTVRVNPLTTEGSVTTSICASGSYTWPLPYGTGLTYTTAQTNLTNVVGCNTATLNLTVTPVTTNGDVTTSICTGGSYTWPLPYGTGLTYTTAQTNLTNVVGCNTATLNLTVTPVTTNGDVTTSICAGGSYTWPLPYGTGLTYTTAQTNLTNVVGCNTATLNLTVTPLTTNGDVTTSICAGGSYTWPLPYGTGLAYTTAQTNLTNVVGCNTATLNLTVTPLTTNGNVTTSICAGGSYVWPLPYGTGLTYTTAQTNLTNVVGCNTATLNLTVTPLTTNGNVTTSICAGGSYTWPLPYGTGLAYTTAQTNLTNVVGCNTATLNLTVTPLTTNGNVTTSICAGGSYTWPLPYGTGLAYTTAQTNLTNVVGCNTATLNLTVTPLTTNGNVTTSICAGGSYVWPLPYGTGLTYTTAQTNLTNVVGCNTATLNLTVTPLTTNGNVTTSICAGGSYTWPLPYGTGLAYTTAQTNLTNVVGCNTATLNLTVTPLTTNGNVTTSICAGGSYTWPLPYGTGLAYTTAQTNLTNVVGCNTATLNLTVTPLTTNGNVTTSICAGGSYVWPLPYGTGLTYTTAQTNLTNVVGCNTATLNLTVTPVTTYGSVTTSICVGGSYTWPLPYGTGLAYTTAQTNLTNVVGCNTATLNLIVKSITSAPSITSPICAGATTVSGTSSEANGTSIEVFKGVNSLGTTIVSSGAWSITVSALSPGDVITAKATAPGKCLSAASTAVTVTANTFCATYAGEYFTNTGSTTTGGTAIINLVYNIAGTGTCSSINGLTANNFSVTSSADPNSTTVSTGVKTLVNGVLLSRLPLP